MINAARFTITAKREFGRGFWKSNLSLQYQTVEPAPAPMRSFADQGFFCQMLQDRKAPNAAQKIPMTALAVGESLAANSIKVELQAMDVHARRAFQAMKINTIQPVRVTTKGRLMLVFRLFQ